MGGVAQALDLFVPGVRGRAGRTEVLARRDVAAHLCDAGHLRDDAARVRDVMQAEARHRAVERAFGERQRGGVRLYIADVAQAGGTGFPAAQCKHPGRDVTGHHLAHARCQAAGDQAGPAGDLQPALSGFGGEEVDKRLQGLVGGHGRTAIEGLGLVAELRQDRPSVRRAHRTRCYRCAPGPCRENRGGERQEETR